MAVLELGAGDLVAVEGRVRSIVDALVPIGAGTYDLVLIEQNRKPRTVKTVTIADKGLIELDLTDLYKTADK